MGSIESNYTTASLSGITLKISCCPVVKAMSLAAWLSLRPAPQPQREF